MDTSLTIASTASRIFPESTDAMTWTIGDHGFAMTLSPRVPELIEARLRPWLESWLGEHGLTIDDIGSWAVHPGGPRILDHIARALELGDDRLAVSRGVLAECGNMSSPTILFILDRLRAVSAPKPIVTLAFGPGLTAEGALIV